MTDPRVSGEHISDLRMPLSGVMSFFSGAPCQHFNVSRRGWLFRRYFREDLTVRLLIYCETVQTNHTDLTLPPCRQDVLLNEFAPRLHQFDRDAELRIGRGAQAALNRLIQRGFSWRAVW